MHRFCTVCGFRSLLVFSVFRNFIGSPWLSCFGGLFLFSFGFSPSHEAAHVLPKCPSYKEETYAKTGEPNVTRPLLRQGADTPLGNRTERVGPRAE